MGHRPLNAQAPRPAHSARSSPLARARLIADLRQRGVRDERVLAVMEKVPRHEFVEESWRQDAWLNKTLPIGLSQTISQPYVVALMTEALLEGTERRRVLEIGTGSGYQTAILAELCKAVFSVERIKALSETARARLRALGYRNIHYAYADGSLGWATHAPFDGIIVTAAIDIVPDQLADQLAVGGRLVLPVGPPQEQVLRVIDRTPRGYTDQALVKVQFVPLLPGRA